MKEHLWGFVENDPVESDNKSVAKIRCANCDQTSNFLYDWSQSITEVKCDCGTVIKTSYSQNHKGVVKLYSKYQSVGTPRVRMNETEDKIRVTLIQLKAANFNGNFIYKKHIRCMVFNIRTGLTYLLPDLFDGKIHKTNKRIRITIVELSSFLLSFYREDAYLFDGGCHSLDYVVRTIRKRLIEKKVELIGYVPSHIKNRKPVADVMAIYGFNEACFNRIPDLPGYDWYLYWSSVKSYPSRYRSFRWDEPFLVQLLKKWKLPDSKAFRRLVSKDIANVPYYSMLYQTFGNINKVLDLAKEGIGYSVGYNVYKIFPEFASLVGAERIYRYLLNDPPGIMIDTANMYYLVKSQLPNYELNVDMNIKAMHDLLAKEVSRLSKASRKIPLTKRELALEINIDSYEFVLPRETHDLISIGNDMNICVGSYADYALEKTCTIVVIKKEGKLVNCIELRGNRIVQAKCECNQYPQGDLRQTILKWAKINRLEITTHDLKQATRKSAW
jgi:hypothetical protein